VRFQQSKKALRARMIARAGLVAMAGLAAWAGMMTLASPAGAAASPAGAGSAPAGARPVFSYVGEAYRASSRGARAVLPVARPHLSRRADHSLAEIAVQSAGSNDIVEAGWVRSRGIAGGPRLFVSYWAGGRDRVDSGFRSTSRAWRPLQVLRAGTRLRLGLRRRNGNWNVYVGGARIGYFPGRRWRDRFRRASIAQAFGEVESFGRSRTQMINGRTDRMISGFRLAGARTPAGYFYATPSRGYFLGRHGRTWFQLGGPGR